MNNLTPDVFASVWRLARQQQQPEDASLARMQKFMLMHEDMHEHFDRLAVDPSSPMEVDGENLILHIAMDAATEASLERGEPEGIRNVMQGLLDAGMDPGVAFHVLSQAMQHSFVLAADQGREMDLNEYLTRACSYAAQAVGGASR